MKFWSPIEVRSLFQAVAQAPSVHIGAKVPGLFALGAGLLGAGLVAVAGGVWMQVAGLRSRRTRSEESLVPVDADRR